MILSKTNLSEEYIKSVTGFFDLETIFDLELTQKNIVSLGSLPKCISLVYLDLSQNKISDITEIDSLIELTAYTISALSLKPNLFIPVSSFKCIFNL